VDHIIFDHTVSMPFNYHGNNRHDALNYGPGTFYYTPSYRGKATIDNKAFVEYLKSLSGTLSDSGDQADIKYQDIPIPMKENESEGPLNPEASKLASEILSALGMWTQQHVYANGSMWTIRHGYQHQTYPHAHDNAEPVNGLKWACVYWAQVPEKSGALEVYPQGIPGNTVKVIPKEGDFLIFPGDVIHGVRQNLNETEERISVSFNMISTSEQSGLDIDLDNVPLL